MTASWPIEASLIIFLGAIDAETPLRVCHPLSLFRAREAAPMPGGIRRRIAADRRRPWRATVEGFASRKLVSSRLNVP